MAPPADVDDTAGFMAAFRSRRQQALSSQSESVASSGAEVEHLETAVEAPVEAPTSYEPSPKQKENGTHETDTNFFLKETYS
jgi:hypothetical protein